MEGQKLGNRSILGERHGPWLSHSLTQSLTDSFTHFFFYKKYRNTSSRLPIYVSDTDANSQDGSSLEFVAAVAARECNIQDARGRGLCSLIHLGKVNNVHTKEFFLSSFAAPPPCPHPLY